MNCGNLIVVVDGKYKGSVGTVIELLENEDSMNLYTAFALVKLQDDSEAIIDVLSLEILEN